MWVVLFVVLLFGLVYVLLTLKLKKLHAIIEQQDGKIQALSSRLAVAGAAPAATKDEPAKKAPEAAASTPAPAPAPSTTTKPAPLRKSPSRESDVMVHVSGLGTMTGAVRVVPPAAAAATTAPAKTKGHRRGRSADLSLPDAAKIASEAAAAGEKPRPLSSRSERSAPVRKEPAPLQDVRPPANPGLVIKKGDLHFGTRLAGIQRRWHRRTFLLHKDGWLGFKGKKSKGQNDYEGWLYVPRCKIYRQGERELRILARCQPLIFPQPGAKASKKFGSSDCLLKTLDATSAEEWSRELSKIPTDPALIDVDEMLVMHDADDLGDSDDDDDLSSDEDSELTVDDSVSGGGGGKLVPLTKPHFVDEAGLRTVSSPGVAVELCEAASSTPVTPERPSIAASASEASLPKRAELRRQESLLIRDPDAEKPKEVPLSDASEEKQGLFALLKKAVGSDLTTISMPISVHEPTTFLQRMAEGLQYHHLLDEAGRCADPVRQIMLTAAFAVAAYSCNVRTYKPFNPYLGETYEYDDGSVRFFAEQVSHHPPIGACVLESANFVFWQDMCVQTKFGGNQLDVSPTGEWHVRYKNNNNHISWLGVKTVVYSIIVGTMWIDCHGKTELVSNTSGEKARVDMTKCGWFNKGRWETTCDVLNSQGKKVAGFAGKWNSELRDANGEVIWRNTLGAARPDDKYGRPDHVFELIANPPELLQRLPPTDSRFRKDLVALQQDDPTRASQEKKALEQRQRQLRAERSARGEEYRPRWFVQGPAPDTGSQMWLFNGEYFAIHGAPQTNERLGTGPNFLAGH